MQYRFVRKFLPCLCRRIRSHSVLFTNLFIYQYSPQQEFCLSDMMRFVFYKHTNSKLLKINQNINIHNQYNSFVIAHNIKRQELKMYHIIAHKLN